MNTSSVSNRSQGSFLVVCYLLMVVQQIAWLSVLVFAGRIPNYDEWTSNTKVFLLSMAGGIGLLLAVLIVIWGIALLCVSAANHATNKERSHPEFKMVGLGVALLAFGAVSPLMLPGIDSNPATEVVRWAVVIGVIAVDAALYLPTVILLKGHAARSAVGTSGVDRS